MKTLEKMSSKGKGKKRILNSTNDITEEVDLFKQLSTKVNGDSSDDTTDSEESVYSGLDDEEATDSEVESIEDAAESWDEDMASDGVDKKNESGSDDDESEEEDDADDESGDTDDDNSSDGTNNNTQKAAASTSKTDQSTPSTSKTTKLKRDKKQRHQDVGNEHKDGTETTVPEVSVHGPDEYEFDSSDEEDLRNTVGNIPMEWYREYEHIGYNLLGKKIIKPAKSDELDKFLNKMDNPDYWRTIADKTTGQSVVLSDSDVQLIRNFRQAKYIDPNVDTYAPWVDFFTHETMQHPVTNRPAEKKSFIPSQWERIQVGRMVHAMKMGWMKTTKEQKDDADKDKDKSEYYMLWKTDDKNDITQRYRSHIPAPKLQLPGHEESYNPPPEYLLTAEEKAAWLEKEPLERKLNFIPDSFSALRKVPAYSNFIKERFQRCLDLYLCPRQRKMRVNVDPEDLLPKLPKPKDLQPFPTTTSVLYKGHVNIVRCISVEPGGQWLMSGSDDGTVKFWEVCTGRCMKTLSVGGVVKDVAWNPNPSFCLAAVAVDEHVIIVNPHLGDKLVISNTDNYINSYTKPDGETEISQAKWDVCDDQENSDGLRLRISHGKPVGQVSWHGRGDYILVVIPKGESKSVLIHQVSRRRTQNPFSKSKGLVQCALFHPTRPYLFVATQRYIRVYNLLKQELTKKLMTNVKWVSSLAVHPGGDNIIMGSYDSKLAWFDLDLSTKPYQTLRHHKKAIRQVCYHKKYPLFASGSGDGSIIVCHGRVYNDLLQNPLIVPVKVLKGHSTKGELGVLDCEFHPTQPWIFSSAGDNTIRLWT